MKRILVLVLVMSFCLFPFVVMADCPDGYWPDKKIGKCVKCPEGKWFHPDVRRCVTIGDDPTGEVDQVMCRQMTEEGQGFMLDGVSCPNRAVYQKCMRSGHKFGKGACTAC